MSETTTEEFAEVKEAAEKAAKIGSTKMTDKVAKLLTQAERAPEGSPEREAFMERAMALSQAYSIDLAIARAHQAKKEKAEEPEERQYKVGEFGRRNTPQGRNAHFVDLMIAICRSFDLEVMISHSNVYVYATGMPSDHEVAERMFAILSVQMVAEADAALKRGENKRLERVPVRRREEIPEDERAWGHAVPGVDGQFYADSPGQVGWREENLVSWPIRHYTLKAPPTHRLVDVLDENGYPVYEEKMVSATDGRVWRANFYEAFVNRTSRRLREMKKQALKEAGVDMSDDSSSGALAIRDKKKTVREAFEGTHRWVLSTAANRKGYTGAEVSRHDWGAQSAGTSAAERARLGDEKDLDGR